MDVNLPYVSLVFPVDKYDDRLLRCFSSFLTYFKYRKIDNWIVVSNLNDKEEYIIKDYSHKYGIRNLHIIKTECNKSYEELSKIGISFGFNNNEICYVADFKTEITKEFNPGVLINILNSDQNVKSIRFTGKNYKKIGKCNYKILNLTDRFSYDGNYLIKNGSGNDLIVDFKIDEIKEVEIKPIIKEVPKKPIIEQVPYVTVVMTTHNRTNVARAVIDSLVKNLKYPKLKWCISDDRSDEGHVDKLVEQFKKNGINEVHVEKTNNERYGLGASLNNGLRYAWTNSDIVLTTEDDWILEKELKLAHYVDIVNKSTDIAGIRLATMNYAIANKRSGHNGFYIVESDGKNKTSVFNNQVMLRHKRTYDNIGYYKENCSGDVSEIDEIRKFNNQKGLAVLYPDFIKQKCMDDSSMYFIHVGKSVSGHEIYGVPERYKWIYDITQKLNDTSIIVAMATFPMRQTGAINVITNLHKQCDLMIVCLNQYDVIPEEFPKYENVKYYLAGEKHKIPDRGCINKMIWLGKYPGYYMTVDDDIIYPSDYCKTYVEHMKKFNNSCIMSYEGRRYQIKNNKPVTMDFKKVCVFSFYRKYDGYNLIHRGGGGVMCMYPSKLPFNFECYESVQKNFGDDELTSVLCQKFGVKIIRPPSENNYLKIDINNSYKCALHTDTKGVAKRNNYMMSNNWKPCSFISNIGHIVYKNVGDKVFQDLINGITENKCNPVNVTFQNHENCIFTIGSIMHKANSDDIIWGTGFISNDKKYYLNDEKSIPKILALRGPLSKQLIEQHGFNINVPYGDPGIFIPFSLGMSRSKSNEIYDIGFIPHVEEFDDFKRRVSLPKNCILIDFRKDAKKCLTMISKCKHIISSSLHGIIFSESLGKPTAWIKLSDKIVGDTFKYYDYYLGSGRLKEQIYMTDWRHEIIFNDIKYITPPVYDYINLLNSAPFIISQDTKNKIINWFKYE